MTAMKNFDCYLADALISVEQSLDSFAQEFAKKHCNDTLHYFVGAGTSGVPPIPMACAIGRRCTGWQLRLYLPVNFSMERLKSFLETLLSHSFISEDASRPLSLRVAAFLPKICANYTIIDAADYPLIGIKPQYRGFISHLVTHAVTNRIDVHLEAINCHPMEIRRYYRCLEY